ncbi:MAG: MFS transporter [Planctomycetota bacterium]|nr:MAG: MFS transporter [Planctomycetota bacterium]
MSSSAAAGRETAAIPRLCVMMFLQFFVWGAWYVSMTGWMGDARLDGLTPWAYSVGPLAAIVSPFFLGMVADRFFPSQKVLGLLHLLGGAFLLAVPNVIEAAPQAADKPTGFFHPFVLLLLGHMLCYMPTLGLTNTVSFHHIASPEQQFPLIRVFGTIGWIAGNIAVTLLPDGDRSPFQFGLAGGAAVLLGLYSFSLPHTPPPLAGQRVRAREILGADALALFKDRNYLVFILCSFLICIPLAGYYNQARNFVGYAGFSNPTLNMSFGQMSEIFFMLAMPLFFARLGVKRMLALGMLAWVLRYGLFSAAADDRIRWMILVGILLHGICYDFFFVTGFIYVDRTAPHAIRGQAQGFLVLITQGLGLGLGAQVFGKLVAAHTSTTEGAEVHDWQQIWLLPGLAAGVILAAFLLLFRDDGRSARQAV